MSTHIILVAPQMAENIGAVARVMGNFDQASLRLVAPHVSPLDEKTLAMSVAARPILESAVVFDTLEAAVADCCTVIGTTAQPRQVIKQYHTPRSLAESFGEMAGPVALVFGPERTGLTNDQVALCQALVQIPVNPVISSLNLSHAVGILLYELYAHKTTATSFWYQGETMPATVAEVDAFLDYLEHCLDQTHFWRTESKKPSMRRNLFGLFKRQTLFSQDVRTLRGMVDALRIDK